MAKPRNIPILVDAAAEVLTIPNVHLQRGATVVAYSGGKAIRGPQCAGLLLGRKDLLMSAWQASSPHHGPGRDNKVGREETMGMLAAVEAWVKRDHQSEWKTWLSWLDTISRRVSTIDSVKTTVREPNGLSNRSPVLIISWDPSKLHITDEEVAEDWLAISRGLRLEREEVAARIVSMLEPSAISITPWMMQPGEDKIVAERIYDLLSKKRDPKPTGLQPPATDLSGRWDVKIEFFSSSSEHSLFIEQKGNRIEGTHKGDFSVREVFGTIEGEQVKLRSTSSERGTGDSVSFIFSGTVSDRFDFRSDSHGRIPDCEIHC